MRTGEKWIIGGAIVASVVIMSTLRYFSNASNDEISMEGIPFYTDAAPALKRRAELLIKDQQCQSCHTLWAVRSPMQNVPAPALDGIGSLRDEQWLFRYISAQDPQQILPSRLKKRFQMPSYAHLAESQRRDLAAYLASLKVEEKFLEHTRKAEYEKLTGNEYPGSP